MEHQTNVGYLLHHLAFVLGRQSDQALQDRLGIGFSQFKIMMCLSRGTAIQQRHIADKLGQTEASVSRQIRLLQDKGLLSSRVSPQNRREHITTLTTKGERLIEKAFVVLNQHHQPVFDRLSSDELERLGTIMTKMHDSACMGDRGCNYV